MGVLYKTIVVAANDLWHFLYLTVLVYAAAALVMFAQFGEERQEFASLLLTFETLINLTLGNLPRNITEDYFLLVCLSAFLLINFFLMLNFIIAIVVDGYTKVKKGLEEDDSEGGFFEDVILVSVAWAKEARATHSPRPLSTRTPVIAWSTKAYR